MGSCLTGALSLQEIPAPFAASDRAAAHAHAGSKVENDMDE
jgi:hypothetical protein